MREELHIARKQFSLMEARYRAKLVNSLTGFKSANLIGTIDDMGNENLAIVSSVFHVGSNPPLIGFISRPNSVARHTLENIVTTEVFTINSVDVDIAAIAHQTSARYDKQESEFEAVGLTPFFEDGFRAPYVFESSLKMGLNLKEHHVIEANQTVLVIGEIEQCRLPQTAIQPDGYVDAESMDIVAISGLDSYHVTQRLYRLDYAKPGRSLNPLSVSGQITQWNTTKTELD
ncbi:flavin reductase family protein [Vibrio europaeus]|uniref:flavin reductase family protein n=1 Tax=Vibrio europaeus TaxID=300876 RepID=UPI00233F1D61|nr:flavin reductase [Vibrio europaeus]MDC5855436.1 flavin reductase [Vibrio europaeus]